MSEKSWKVLKYILIIGSVLAALKIIFVDYTLDEEYQIVMAYRYLNGDHLFKQMWEPHQTSAFLCAGLLWLYSKVTGTYTGVVLFLRIMTTIVQVALTHAVYRTIVKKIEKDYAFLLALLFFNITPKIIQIPEFSNMQLWFLVIPVLLIMKYYDDREKDRWYLLIPAGISLACEVLTYPTCIILFPFFAFYLWKKSGKHRWRDIGVLTVTCAVCAGIWLLMVFQHISLEEFLANVTNLLSFDPTHHISGMTDAKGKNYIDSLIIWSFWCAVISIVSGVICFVLHLVFRKKEIQPEKKAWWLMFWVIAVVISEFVQLYYWVILRIGYEYLQMHLLILWIGMLATWHLADENRKYFIWGIVATIIAYVGVIYISDLALYYTLPHGGLGLVFAVAVMILALQNIMKDKARPWILLLVVSLILCSMGGKAFTLRGGKSDNSILSVGGIMKDGPAAGIFAEYMNAYIYNCNYEDYAQYVQEGDNVLIVANMIMSAGTTPYMFENVNVSHFSIVDPTTYDEKLLTYWELYPEKAPDVIVVDCWYGSLMENPESWIMKYIENDFGYTSVNDGRYARFYRR